MLRIAANGLNDQIVNGDRREQLDLFAGICEGASHDDLTFVLLNLHDRGIKVDVAVGLPRVLARTDGERHDETIYLHGRSQDSDEFRARAVAAITHHVTATTPTAKLIRQLVDVCRTDPSAAVRGSALIGLSTCWDHDDRAGLDRFISQLGTAADIGPYAQPARDNLLTSAELKPTGASDRRPSPGMS